MALILAETKIPTLIVAYLAYRRNDADYPTPSSGSLALVAGPVKETVQRSHPSLEVWVPSFDLVQRRDLEQVEVMLDLHCSPDTAQSTEDGWLAAIRRAFAGGPLPGGAGTEAVNPFLYYLAALSEADRADWKIDNFLLTGGQTIIADDRRIIRRTSAQCWFRSHVFTV